MTQQKQNSEIRFKCSKEEHDKIQAKAEEVGMNIKQYLLHLGLHSNLKISVE